MIAQSEIVAVIQRMVDRSSQRQVADKLGISYTYLNDILHGRTDVSENVALKLGYQRRVIFERVKT